MALVERDHFSPRLHARSLFGEDESAAREVDARSCEQDRDLERKDVFAVDVLMHFP